MSKSSIEETIINWILDHLVSGNSTVSKIKRLWLKRFLNNHRKESLCDLLSFDDLDIIALIMSLEKTYNVTISDDLVLQNANKVSNITLTQLINIVYTLKRK